MNRPFFSKGNRKVTVGFSLLFAAIIFFPFVHYYFGSFYSSSRGAFKEWYPRFHWVVYPLVKAAPFLFLSVLIWLLYKTLLQLPGLIAKWTKKYLIEAPITTLKTVVSFLFQLLKRNALNLLLTFVSVFIVLVIAENQLKKRGFKPGYRIYSIYFKEVDSLYEINGFFADSNGVLCISNEARNFICDELAAKNFLFERKPLNKNQTPEVYSLPDDFLQLRDTCYESAFKTFTQNLLQEHDSSEADFSNAVINYIANPINSNGFKSIEFKKYHTKRKSILLLGDSFTWGHSARNKTNCFADLLLAKGYVVYNSGITGVDPAQYLKISKELIPILKPDYVVVNFYMGNDITYFKRDPQPYQPVFFCTNAGNLLSCPEGIYFKTPQEAYNHTVAVFRLPDTPFAQLCSKTVVSTLLWRALAKFNLVDASLPKYKRYYAQVNSITTKTPYSDNELKQIQELALKYNCKFLLVIIPSFDGSNFTFPQRGKILNGLKYFVPSVSKQIYDQHGDGHYNDLGHAMHAAFIDSLIRSNP